jgi:hypothetical protein
MLAAPAGSAVVADCDGLDDTDDSALLGKDLFSPGLRKLGGFQAAAVLAAPHPLLVHNTGTGFLTDWVRDSYHAASAPSSFKSSADKLKESAIADWIGTLK